MSSTVGVQEIDLSPTFSSAYWGFVLSCFLGGITILQAYIYFPNHRDRMVVQVMAAVMLILDLTSSALVAQSIFYYLIPHFGSLTPFSSVTPELSAECLISTLITFISQMYFVYQLLAVKQLGMLGWVMIAAITASGVLACAGGIGCVTSMYIFHHGVLSDRSEMFRITFGLAKGFGAVCDLLATIAMCLFLKISRTGITSTNKMVHSLIQFVIHRGALVTTIQIALVVTFFASPHTINWLGFHMNVTKLYANTFFAMLNGREHLREKQLVDISRFTNDTDRYQLSAVSDQGSKMPTISKTIVIAEM